MKYKLYFGILLMCIVYASTVIQVKFIKNLLKFFKVQLSVLNSNVD